MMIALLLGNGYPDYMDISFIRIILTTNFLSLLLFFFKNEPSPHLKGQSVRASFLFLIGFVIAHFQIYLDILLGYLSEANSILFINTRIAVKSLLISSIAFNAFCLGYVLNTKNIMHPKNNQSKPKYVNTRLLFYGVILLLLLYFSPISGPWSILFECAVSALLIIKARNLVILEGFNVDIKKTLLYFKEAIIPLSIYLLYLLSTGERGTIIFNVLFLTGVVLHVSNLKLGNIRMVIILFLVSSALTLIGIARKFEDKDSLIDKLRTALETRETESSYRYPDSFSPSTKELASSGRIVNIAVNEIENGVHHTYGIFFAQDLMLIIPSLRSTFVDVFSIPNNFIGSPEYFTHIDLGAHANWGVGTSCVADTYMDFGLLGIVIIFLLFGIFMRTIDLTIYRKEVPNFLLFTISLLVLSYSVYISRSSILYFLNKFPYIIIFAGSLILINKIRTRNT